MKHPALLRCSSSPSEGRPLCQLSILPPEYPDRVSDFQKGEHRFQHSAVTHLCWVGEPAEPALSSGPPVTQRTKGQHDAVSPPREELVRYGQDAVISSHPLQMVFHNIRKASVVFLAK